MHLVPTRLALAGRGKDWELAKKYHITSCVECGCCGYVCPASLPLVQLIRMGKAHMPKDAVPAFEKLVFGTDESPAGLEENIIRFNKMLDACDVSEESRKMCYYGTMAKIHNIDVSKYLEK